MQFATSTQMRNQTVPSYFEAMDIQSFAETWTYVMNETGGEMMYGMYRVDVENAGEWLGGHNFDLFYRPANQSDHNLFLKHYWSEWIILPFSHDLEWINGEGISRGTILEENELNTDYANEKSKYTAKCSHFEVRCFFGYNETLYSSPTDAWDHHGLNILIGINFDQIATTMNAWALIGMILFFEMPDVHPMINFFIALPFWISFAYLIYRLILFAIPFVGGS